MDFSCASNSGIIGMTGHAQTIYDIAKKQYDIAKENYDAYLIAKQKSYNGECVYVNFFAPEQFAKASDIFHAATKRLNDVNHNIIKEIPETRSYSQLHTAVQNGEYLTQKEIDSYTNISCNRVIHRLRIIDNTDNKYY